MVHASLPVLLISIAFPLVPLLAQEWEETTEETQELVALNEGLGDEFGNSVAISGSVAVVAARSDDDDFTDAGSVYIFRYDPDFQQWIEEAQDDEEVVQLGGGS